MLLLHVLAEQHLQLLLLLLIKLLLKSQPLLLQLLLHLWRPWTVVLLVMLPGPFTWGLHV